MWPIGSFYSGRIINYFAHTILIFFAPSDIARRDLSIDQIKKKSHTLTPPMTCLWCTADAHERQRRRRRDRHRAAALGRTRTETGSASGAGLRACDRRCKSCKLVRTPAHGNAHANQGRSVLTRTGRVGEGRARGKRARIPARSSRARTARGYSTS